MSEEKEFEVIMTDEVKEQVNADPESAEALRDFSATVRQAMAGVKSGQYKNFDEAMEVLTGNRPEKIEDWDEGDDEID